MRKAALLLALALPALAQTPPDLIIINAKVYTADPANKTAEAIAIRDGRIVGVGTTEQILAMGSPKTRTIDAKKHLVVPGFNDAHTHQTPTPADRSPERPSSTPTTTSIASSPTRSATRTRPSSCASGSTTP